MPDLGITKALDMLGFSYETKVFDSPDDFPIDELTNDLPAAVGPLNMGFLTYNPNHRLLAGVDHFLFVYHIDEKCIYAHDPAGFPHVFLPIEKFRESWRAEGIGYKKGYYRYTFAPRRTGSPSDQELYKNALDFFKTLYEERSLNEGFISGAGAVEEFSDYAKKNGLNDEERAHFVYFALPLGAKRASDYVKFFVPFSKELSDLKYAQSKIFGAAHSYAVEKNWDSFAESLVELADIDEQFKKVLLASS